MRLSVKVASFTVSMMRMALKTKRQCVVVEVEADKVVQVGTTIASKAETGTIAKNRGQPTTEGTGYAYRPIHGVEDRRHQRQRRVQQNQLYHGALDSKL